MPFLDEDGVTRLTEDYLDIFAPKEELGEDDGTNAGPIYELSAKGHAEQFGTTGKNLIPPPVNGGVYSNVTITYGSDGSVILNGTTSGTINLWCQHVSLAAGTYTLSVGENLPEGVWVSISNNKPMVKPSNKSATVTIGELAEASLLIYVNSGVTFSNFRLNPQLELGSEATTYEPYTGGAPSPSPDYPQEIQVVRGRNLLDESSADWKENYTINSSGVETANSSFKYSQGYIPVSPSTQYTFQFNKTIVDSASTFIVEYNASKTFVTRIEAVSSASTTGLLRGTFTTGSGTRFVRICISKAIGDPQLTEGSTPQPYVPYGHVGMEVQGKNLIDLSLGNLGAFTLSEGHLRATNNNYNTAKFPVNLSPNESYCVSCKAVQANTLYRIQVFGVTGNAGIASAGIDTFSMKINFQAPSDGLVEIRAYGTNANSGNIDLYDIQLERGTVATDYQPYYHSTTPIPLPDRGWVGGLPDGTSDILTLDGAGKCEWTLPTSEVVLDGDTTAFTLYDAGTSSNASVSDRFGIPLSGQLKPGTDITKRLSIICSHAIAKAGTVNSASWRIGTCMLYDAGFLIVLSAQTKESANTWLSTHPVTVLYPLATPIHESKGYIEDWPTDIPEGATITIPELDALNVKYFVANDSISQYSEQWYNRTQDLDIAQVEDAIGDLTSITANLVTHDLFYFGYDEVNGKKMISIFKRGDI